MPELQPGTTMHRIGELERITRELRQDVRELRGLHELAEGRIRQLEAEHEADVQREAWELREAAERIRDLEGQTPQARQLQLEADQAAADLAESGYDRHGRDCRCSYCATDEGWPEERSVSEYHREEFALDKGEEPR